MKQKHQDKGNVPKIAGAVGYLGPSMEAPALVVSARTFCLWWVGCLDRLAMTGPPRMLRREGARLWIQARGRSRGSTRCLDNRSLSGTWHFQVSFLAKNVTQCDTIQNAELLEQDPGL